MRPREIGMLVALGALWGGSFLFIRVAAPVMGPPALVALRTLLAGAVLLLYGVLSGQRPALRARWREFLVLGALNAALPFVLIAAAELRLPASLAAILNATVPVFTGLVLAVWTGEAPSQRAVTGMVLGLCGVVVLVGWSTLPLDGATILAVAASLLAALSYGAGGVYAKTRLGGMPPLTLATGQLLGAGLLILPFAAATPPASVPSRTVLLAIAGLVLLATALGYLLYFGLLTSVGPMKTHSVTYLVPFFGLLWGRLFLAEPIGVGTIVGLGIVLAGVMLVTGVRIRVSRPSLAWATVRRRALVSRGK
jgi:drug/metabolite transporter (DMT)-like permease